MLIATALASLLVTTWVFDLHQYLEPDALTAQQEALRVGYVQHPLLGLGIYVAAYVVLTGASVPGATFLTLAGGAVFGLVVGTAATSVASTLGATLAFWTSRYLFRDALTRRFPNRAKAIDAGIRKEGAFYLFALRMVPVFPFFAVNALCGLTGLKTRTYAWVSLVGMLPGTLAYVHAGTRLGEVTTASDLVSFELLLSFALLGVLPLASRLALAVLRRRRRLARFSRPRKPRFDVVVIGAGAGGLVATYAARFLRARVALVERHAMGGDCLNTGCVPSKALLHWSRVVADMREARRRGLLDNAPEPRFDAVLREVRAAVAGVAPHDSVERYRELGAEVLSGRARLLSPFEVEVNGESGRSTLSTRNVVIATGAAPVVPDIPGIDGVDALTSETLWQLEHLPERLLVVGGGAIGCELSQAFQRLGARVTLVETGPRLLAREEPDCSQLVLQALLRDGVEVHLKSRVERFESLAESKVAHLLEGDSESSRPLQFDRVLVAVGRAPRSRGLGLDELGVVTRADGSIWTDAYGRTSLPHVLACGDVTGSLPLTHAAGHQGFYAAFNALFSPFFRLSAVAKAMPRCTFTDPAVASVGLTLAEAETANRAVDVTRYELSDLDRAIADSNTDGFVQVLTTAGQDAIVGVSVVSRHAGEMISEWSLAMTRGLGLKRILSAVRPYPTYAEANRAVASAWAKQRAPQRTLDWLERWHRLRRNG